jgi:hypothetical protein
MKADRGSTWRKKIFDSMKKGVSTKVKLNVFTVNKVTRGSTKHKKT